MQEIEVKFLNIDPKIIQDKLRKIGAQKTGEYFQRWKTFDYPDWRLDKNGAWIRLRDEGNGQTTLSFKQRLGRQTGKEITNDSGMEEIEIKVSDFDQTALFFKKIGFVEKHYAEKKRISWIKDNTKFDIDIYPQLDPYLEIETISWEKIDEAISLLGLNPEDKKIFSANQAYALKGIDISKIKIISFDQGLVNK